MKYFADLVPIPQLGQIFVRRNEIGKITLILGETVDEVLAAGSGDTITEFLGKLCQRFDVGAIQRGKIYNFNGCEIVRDYNGGATMAIHKYLERLKPILLSRTGRRQKESEVSEFEKGIYRQLAGTMMYLGNEVLPQTSYATYRLQEHPGDYWSNT